MQATAKTYREHRILNAPYITFELPQPDEHEGTYVTPKFAIRYDVREFVVDRREVYDVEILDVDLESAVAWIGDCGVNVPCGDTNFEVSAFAMWQRWYDYYSTAGRCWPNRELIDAKIRQHYLSTQD
jgi:hypothetical protein